MTPSSSCAPKSDERDKVETTSEGHFRSDLPTFRSPAIAAVAADTLGLAKNVDSGLPSFHQSVPPSFPASTSSSSFVFLQHSTAVGLKLLVLFDSFHRSFSLQLLLKLLALGSVDIVYDRLSLSASKWWVRAAAFSGQMFETYSCSWNILPVVYPIIPPPIAAKRPSLRPAS